MTKNPILRLIRALPAAICLFAVSVPALAGEAAKPAMHGLASVYSKDYAGGRTASGEINRHGAMTAAHRTLPFGTRVRVVNRRNGKSVEVRINDRGPFIRGRVIDLSPAAARVLGVSGLAPVSMTVVRGRPFSAGSV